MDSLIPQVSLPTKATTPNGDLISPVERSGAHLLIALRARDFAPLLRALSHEPDYRPPPGRVYTVRGGANEVRVLFFCESPGDLEHLITLPALRAALWPDSRPATSETVILNFVGDFPR